MIDDDLIFFLLFLDSSSEVDDPCYQAEWRKNIFSMPKGRFYNKFRMKKETFKLISNQLKVYQKKEKPIKKFDLKLATFLAFLAEKSSYRSLRGLFGFSIRTVWNYVNEINNFIFENSGKFIRLPTVAEYQNLANGFEELGAIRNTVLSIDGTHIRIKNQKEQIQETL